MVVGNVSPYRFSDSPSDASYQSTIAGLLGVASRVGFICREPRYMSDKSNALVSRLKPMLVKEEEASAWPGTRLLGARTMPHFIFNFNEVVASEIQTASNSFSNWLNPGLPEDLHFLRADDSVILGSIAHENEVWLDLTNEEASILNERLKNSFIKLVRDLGVSPP